MVDLMLVVPSGTTGYAVIAFLCAIGHDRVVRVRCWASLHTEEVFSRDVNVHGQCTTLGANLSHRGMEHDVFSEVAHCYCTDEIIDAKHGLVETAPQDASTSSLGQYVVALSANSVGFKDVGEAVQRLLRRLGDAHGARRVVSRQETDVPAGSGICQLRQGVSNVGEKMCSTFLLRLCPNLLHLDVVRPCKRQTAHRCARRSTTATSVRRRNQSCQR